MLEAMKPPPRFDIPETMLWSVRYGASGCAHAPTKRTRCRAAGRRGLNLLVTLRTLLRESSVTRTAELLGQTQPMVSRALAALRVVFDDQLLVRAGRSMTLTPLAISLKTPLERSLGSIDRLRGPWDVRPRNRQTHLSNHSQRRPRGRNLRASGGGVGGGAGHRTPILEQRAGRMDRATGR